MYDVHFLKWIMLKKTVQERSCEGLRATLDTWIKDSAAKGHHKKKAVAAPQSSITLQRRKSVRSAAKEADREVVASLDEDIKQEAVEPIEVKSENPDDLIADPIIEDIG